MKWFSAFVIAAFLAISSSFAFAAQPLVDVQWLKENLDKPDLVVLDIRSRLSGASVETYKQGHIPGAVYSNYVKAGWRVKDQSGTPGMLPKTDKLAELIGGLGIDNDTHVVIVSGGGSGSQMGAATRVYWTFKVLGHDEVSILNGGMAAWTSERDEKTKKPVNPLESGMVMPAAKTFEVNFRPELIATRQDVEAARSAGTALLDHRPNHQYIGVSKSGAVTRAGTIGEALNVPETWLTREGRGMIRTKEQLTKLYNAAGAPTSGKSISFCNTGHWASLGWFTSYAILGNKDATLYDGSMAEWSRTNLPMVRKVTAE